MTDIETKPAAAPVAARPAIRLLPGRHKRVLAGHPWVYSNEIHMDAAARALPLGTPVRLIADDSRALGVGSFNPRPLIAVRLLSRDPDAVIDQAFVTDRLRRALELRDRLYDRPFYRLVHAEADGLPAMVIDRYGDAVVIQANSAGADAMTPMILHGLDALIAPATVILRNDSAARVLEGLEQTVSVVRGEVDGAVPLEENGTVFFAEVLGGQKTGWFYDQRDNRAFAAALAAGGSVVDFYAFQGGFAVQAARAGAARVLAVDRSAGALELAARAAEANGVADRCTFRKNDVFNEMERLRDQGVAAVVAHAPQLPGVHKDDVIGTHRGLTEQSRRLLRPGGAHEKSENENKQTAPEERRNHDPTEKQFREKARQ